MFKKITLGVVIIISSAFLLSQTPIFINEIHYDNDGTDTGEGIEIAGPAGTNLTGWSLVLYRDVGTVYYTENLSGTIPDLCNGGILSFPISGIQNGPADGVALVNGVTLIQLLSYEGTLTATEGPANGVTSTDIGVSETSTTTVGFSLQLEGVGTFYEDFTWVGPLANTFGDCNGEQTLPVELSSFTTETTVQGILLQWTTESEIENLGFILDRKSTGSDWHEIVNYKNDESLLGQGTFSFTTDYEYVDKLVQQGNTYEYRLADVDYNDIITYHATREVTVDSNPLTATADNFTVMAYPNPFNPSTTIRYSIPDVETHSNASVLIAIYDITGKLITTLINKEQPSGWHEVQWNGTNQNSKEVPGGVYLSRVTVGNKVKTNKLILLK